MKALLTLLFFCPLWLSAQDCSCTDNLNWLINTFEENDAGFQYVIDQKGKEAYLEHNSRLKTKAAEINTVSACTELMVEWTKFFRSGHLGVVELAPQQDATEELSEEEVIAKYQNEPTFEISNAEFESILAGLGNEPSFEGIWQSGNYKVAVVKNEASKDWEYVGFVLEADGIYWHKNQIKFQLGYTNETGNRVANYYMRNHSLRSFPDAALVGKNVLKIGFVMFERVYPAFEEDHKIAEHFELLSARNSILKKLSEKTILLRIPSFDHSNKKFIDSLITVNHELLASTENLIIDLRNNGGGSDESYYGILPYIYTNPIRTVGVELLSTPLNNRRMEDFMVDPDFSDSEKEWAKNGLAVLNEHIGEFVNLDSTVVDIMKYDDILPYPKNVGIIINENCGSTTEQFLLAAKQSRKVKLFGTTTTGVLDISNMYHVNSPCDEMQLWYSLSRSMRIPDFTIDEKGIQPDFYMDRSISEYDWLEFVKNRLEE